MRERPGVLVYPWAQTCRSVGHWFPYLQILSKVYLYYYISEPQRGVQWRSTSSVGYSIGDPFACAGDFWPEMLFLLVLILGDSQWAATYGPVLQFDEQTVDLVHGNGL